MRYRKKPIVIEAYQIKEVNNNMPEWLEIAIQQGRVVIDAKTRKFTVTTIEGVMTAGFGDWVIKGIKNELYPVRDDIFQQTYERVY